MIDHNNPLPLYYQLANLIRKEIEQGLYKEGDKIPSERDLKEKFKISRVTVNKAINLLIEDGFLTRKRGQGTFINSSKVEFFPGLLGFTEIIKNKNMIPSSKVILKKIINPDKFLCEKLKISKTDKVMFTERIRLANNQIINLEKSYIPLKLCENLFNIDLSTHSIYKELSKKGYKPSKATQEIKAILSDEELSKYLKISLNEAVLKNTRLTFSKETPIQYSINYYKGDIYSIIMSINN
ncbi:MAG: GntR family transcriptional regulator [Fusobacterium sp. JB021]|nr:GntR family transcriptional regulator [Fusobacterium sp. JB021]MDP0506801.1 GntR family transcriptional regulator [Fusobacterium sp. JB019]